MQHFPWPDLLALSLVSGPFIRETYVPLSPCPPAQIPQTSLKFPRVGTGPEHPGPHTWYGVWVRGEGAQLRCPALREAAPPTPPLADPTFMLHTRSVPGAIGPLGWAGPPLISRNQQLADGQASRHTGVKCVTAAHIYLTLIMSRALGQVPPPSDHSSSLSNPQEGGSILMPILRMSHREAKNLVSHAVTQWPRQGTTQVGWVPSMSSCTSL